MCSVVLKNVSFRYMNQKDFALKNVNLHIKENEFVLILGESGSGKSTLGYLICGLAPNLIPGKVRGEILIDGIDVNSLNKRELIQKVNMLLQDPDAQLTYLTVEDELKFPMENVGVDEEEIKLRTDYLLKKFDLSKLRDTYVFNLSYGQKQRTCIASILALDPKIIILDEPLSHQDEVARKRIIDFLKEMKGKRTIIVMEHRAHALLKLCDRVVVLEKGCVKLNCSVNEALKVGIANNFNLNDLTKIFPKRSRFMRSRKAILVVRDLWFTYDGRNYILAGVNFKLNKGDLAFIIGPNGAGKSTLGMVLSGMLSPHKGTILVNGINIGSRKVNRGICYVPQNPDLVFLHDTLYEDVLNSALKSMDLKRGRKFTRELIKAFNLWHLRNNDPHSLSRGERVRAAIAIMSALKPRVLIADEPFSGQDKRNIIAIMNCLNYLRERYGITIIIITHEADLAKSIGDKVFLMKNGKLYGEITCTS